MRRDPIFYQMFQRSPQLLFDLIGICPANGASYRFDSVSVKEPKFEIDGVFLPPETEIGIVYFCEVQFQKDELLYERLFGELFLYFYRSRLRFTDWRAVLIYPSRSVEQRDIHPYQDLLNSERVYRIFLDELGDIEDLSIPVAATVLTILDQNSAPQVARDLLNRTEREVATLKQKEDLQDIITSIMVYKFANLSRQEIRAMLGLDLTTEPRAIREAKDEGRQEGRIEGRQEGRIEGQRLEALTLIIRLLTRRLKQDLPEQTRLRLADMPLILLEELSEALLDFSTMADLESWLSENN